MPPDATTAGPEAPGASGAATDFSRPEQVFEVGAGRKTFYAVVVLLLLPFFVSLGPMLANRIRSGLWDDMVGFAILAVGLAIVFSLLVVELLRSLMTRISLGPDAVTLTLPPGRRTTPFSRYVTRTLPYEQIAAVETRREIYGGSLAPVLLRGARIVTKDGETIRLGYVSEADVDPVLPVDEIAEAIARRAGVDVEHRGNVWRNAPRKMLGLISPDAEARAVDETGIAALNRAHARIMLALVGGLAALVVFGIASDLLTAQSNPSRAFESAPVAPGTGNPSRARP